MAAEQKPERRDKNLEAYREQQAALEAEHRGEYDAPARDRDVGVYPDFDTACAAVARYRHKLVFEIGDVPILSPVRALKGRKLGPLALRRIT